MHPRLISARPTSAGASERARARWLCHLTHDLKQRLTCSSPLRARERLCNRAISARDAEAESKSLSPSPSPSRRERSRALPRSLLPLSSVFQVHRSPFASSICPAAPLRLDSAKPFHLRRLRRSERRYCPSLKNIALRKDLKITNAEA